MDWCRYFGKGGSITFMGRSEGLVQMIWQRLTLYFYGEGWRIGADDLVWADPLLYGEGGGLVQMSWYGLTNYFYGEGWRIGADDLVRADPLLLCGGWRIGADVLVKADPLYLWGGMEYWCR